MIEKLNGLPEAFADTGMHYNPEHMEHPEHAGDLPLLLSTHGAAWSAVYTGRFNPDDVVGRSVIVHAKPDDYRTQPSGDSGEKLPAVRFGNGWWSNGSNVSIKYPRAG